MPNLLKVSNISKSYPGVLANDDVSLSIGRGEIHALLGENGAGKSTLVKIIFGLVRPDSGSMTMNGKAFSPSEPSDARAAGIAMVFQHFSLFDALTVAENMSLGMENPPSRRVLAADIRRKSEEFDLEVNPDRLAGDLAAGERQRVEIIRSLLQNPRLIILDEPTSVLTPGEAESLFATLRQLSREGTAVLYISHKLAEIRGLCQKATILRAGRIVTSCDPREHSARSLAELMVGTSLLRPERSERARRRRAVLSVRNLDVEKQSLFGVSLRKISFDVSAGEILGIGGVSGNGQSELVAALSGEVRTRADMISLNAIPLGAEGPTTRRAKGLLTAPEERVGHAAAGSMSLSENALLTASTRMKLAPHGFIGWKATRRFAKAIIEAFDVRTSGTASTAAALSGGNLQKFVIGREILQRPEAFVVNQPTWGVDAAAAAAIRQALLDLAVAGCAVIAVSQDLDELLEISDRFAVLNEGRLSDIIPVEELSGERIGLMMAGSHPSRQAVAEEHVAI